MSPDNRNAPAVNEGESGNHKAACLGSTIAQTTNVRDEGERCTLHHSSPSAELNCLLSGRHSYPDPGVRYPHVISREQVSE